MIAKSPRTERPFKRLVKGFLQGFLIGFNRFEYGGICLDSFGQDCIGLGRIG